MTVAERAAERMRSAVALRGREPRRRARIAALRIMGKVNEIAYGPRRDVGKVYDSPGARANLGR